MIFYTTFICFITLFLEASVTQNNVCIHNNDKIKEKYSDLIIPYPNLIEGAQTFNAPKSSNEVIFIKELVEQIFFSKYLSFHDQLSNRMICKLIKNHTFENETKRAMQYWLSNSYHIPWNHYPLSDTKDLKLFDDPGSLHAQTAATISMAYVSIKILSRIFGLFIKNKKNIEATATC